MSADPSSKEESVRKAIVAAHESVANLLSVFIPILAVLFVGFQNTADAIEVLGAKFKPSQGAMISVILIIVACYFSARNLFVMRNLLEQIQDKSLSQMTLQASAVLLNPFTEVGPGFLGRVFNYSGLVLMHIAPIWVVFGFSDLIVSKQRSFTLATLHFVLAGIFAIVYFSFCAGLTAVIDIVNPTDAPLRRRILYVTIAILVVAVLVYGYIANLPNLREAIQDMNIRGG